ncbi:hypothetical protein EKO04_001964 [Ascochyta lentis]|uniref:Uncharacterized protein n=1 Tax=Ascochyta lentis TaxID=205686 RepID=A0A8H7JCW5_9PLEO|nr:hypothetical protein EKO04_001964 [Ascochyta lentis]
MFRFLDLPREIRDKIYSTLLCSFDPRPDSWKPSVDPFLDPDFMNALSIAEHAIDTSILLTSKQIHREAYDIMVKTNRFVRLTTSSGLPIRLLLNHLRVPVVTDNKESVEGFQGYVLSVSLTASKDLQQRPVSTDNCDFMLLSRDMDVFCDTLADGDVHIPRFGLKVAIKIAVAPGREQSTPAYKDPISDFFSEKTQKVLLQPFRTRLRGFKKVKVRGLVSREIAEAVEEEIAQDAASDPEAVVSNFQTQKDEGQELYKSNEIEKACLKWQDAALEIEQLHQGSSWSMLTEKGGVPFVTRLAELYFLMKLNSAHVQINAMQKGGLYADVMAKDALTTALLSLRKDHWMRGFRWRPTDVQRAKWRYRHALFLRLDGDPSTISGAVSSIESAHRLLPNDAGIARERETILAWRDSTGY